MTNLLEPAPLTHDHSPRQRPPRLTRRVVLMLAVILVLAVGLRLYRSDAKSLWSDEFASAVLTLGHGYPHQALPSNVLIPTPPDLNDLHAAAPLWQVWGSETQGIMPPLYNVMLRLWVDTFGLNDRTLRGFSTLCSVAAIAMLFLTARELHGANVGLWAALLMAVAGPQIQYGQEARNYGLLLLAALAAAALVRLERRGASTWRTAAFGASLLAVTLTHYFAVGAVLTLALYAMIRLDRTARLHAAAAIAIVAMIWLFAWAPFGLGQFQNVDDPNILGFLQDGGSGFVWRHTQRIAVLPSRYFSEPMDRSRAVATLGGAILLAAVLMPLRRKDLLLWGMWLPLTILPVALLDLVRGTKHVEMIRYTLLASPAAYALVAAALSTSRGFVRHVPPLLATVACLLTVHAAYDVWWKADWRALAGAVERNFRQGDVILFVQGDEQWQYPHAAFLHTSFYSTRRPGPIVLQYGELDPGLVRRLRDAPGILIIALDNADALGRAIPDVRFQWLAHEPGAGKLWRARWGERAATTTPTTAAAPTPTTNPPGR